MKKTKTVNLIKGNFAPEEATEVLLELLNSKIKFHSMKIWSSEERLGKPDALSQQKLEYFRETREKLKIFLAEAKRLQKNINRTFSN
ncbi:MAG: hypothetical protein M3521_14310 [Acidobacteriota bacterium]|nr:hypothetical protein [Acidobacteriota bacterium]